MRIAAALLLVAVALTAARAPAAASGSPCERPRIGFLGPLTGEAAFIGKDQLGFARYAVRTVGRRTVRLVEADTQLDPARAAKAAAALHANPDVLAVVGPAGSQEVLAAAPVLQRPSRLAFVSASALGAALTNGSVRGFFRVVPSERAQAPTISRFLLRRLKPRSVAIVDDRSGYSRALAARVGASLQAARVEVSRHSVDRRTTRFGRLVARIGEVDVVFVPWQIAANAQAFGEQLRARGSEAVVVGSDAVDSRDFVLPGAYVTSFAPDVRAIPGNEGFVAGYGGRFGSRFGPPAYVAAQVAILAVRRACADGRATRAEVEQHLRATSLRRTVLGGPLEFTARGEVKGARFFVFKLDRAGARALVR